MHAFIFTRLDCCSSLYTCLNRQSLHKLQLVQNTAARLFIKTEEKEHITPDLASLHWLLAEI